MEGIETSNVYNPLKLQSLGTTRGRNSWPEKDLSPSKRMQKQSKKNAAFMAALHNKLAQVDNLDSMRNNREKSMQALLLLDEWQTSQHPLPDTRMMKEFRTTM
jgi:hypothetical protein